MRATKASKLTRTYRPTIEATVVGVYAANAVGKLTHPDTNIHPHIVYADSKGTQLNEHLEDFGVSSGSILFLAKP